MRLLIVLMLVWGNLALAEIPEQLKAADLIQAQLQEHNAVELQTKLEIAEALAENAERQSKGPIVFVLDGAEVQLFLHQHYREQKTLVDLASRLAAFGYVELKVGKNYLDGNALSAKELPSFFTYVANAAAEKVQLEQAGYISF